MKEKYEIWCWDHVVGIAWSEEDARALIKDNPLKLPYSIKKIEV